MEDDEEEEVKVEHAYETKAIGTKSSESKEMKNEIHDGRLGEVHPPKTTTFLMSKQITFNLEDVDEKSQKAISGKKSQSNRGNEED